MTLQSNYIIIIIDRHIFYMNLIMIEFKYSVTLLSRKISSSWQFYFFLNTDHQNNGCGLSMSGLSVSLIHGWL